eukprot:s5937_g1.t1
MFVLERSPPPSSDMANHVSEEEPVAVERAAEEPVAVERAAEEQQEWAHRRWPKPRETETPVSKEQTIWRALQLFHVREYPEYGKKHLTGLG